MARPPHRGSADRDEAVQRRLALLGEELSGLRTGVPGGSRGWDMPDSHTRIRGRPDPEGVGEPAVGLKPWPKESEPPEEIEVAALPTPGRHAHRLGSGSRWPAAGLARAPLAAVLALVAAALAVLCWWLLRTAAHPSTPVEMTPLSATGAPSAERGLATPAAALSPGASAAGGKVTVDVEGKVRRPGIVVLEAGSRVIDAIKAAGGVRAGRRDASLNLARVLVDGEQILVGVPAPPGLPAGAATASAAAQLVDLNTADEAALEALPEIGPVTAQSILAWRTENGAFTSVRELLEVDGIGAATLDRLLPYVTV
jgi:competence protein ComEA